MKAVGSVLAGKADLKNTLPGVALMIILTVVFLGLPA